MVSSLTQTKSIGQKEGNKNAQIKSEAARCAARLHAWLHVQEHLRIQDERARRGEGLIGHASALCGGVERARGALTTKRVNIMGSEAEAPPEVRDPLLCWETVQGSEGA